MKKHINTSFAIMLLTFSLTGCGGVNLGDRIDFLGGHPNDPMLPDYAIGATDIVLDASDPVELRDILYDGLEFAFERVDSEPRYLFALGRIAYFLDYEGLADSLLMVSANKGSIPANAYLGMMALDKENYPDAFLYLKTAINEGFDDPIIDQLFADLNFDAYREEFNHPKMINAFFYGDESYLKSIEWETKTFIYILHNRLWESEILWLVEDKEMVLELDSDLSSLPGFPSLSDLPNFLKNVPIEKIAVEASDKVLGKFHEPSYRQDAWRLAIIYNKNPEAFRKIYNNMVAFCNTTNS